MPSTSFCTGASDVQSVSCATDGLPDVGGGTKARSTPQDITQPVLLAVKCEETSSSATGPVQLIYIAIQVSKNTDGLPPKLIIYLLVSTRNELRKHKKRTGRTGGANVRNDEGRHEREKNERTKQGTRHEEIEVDNHIRSDGKVSNPD